MCVCVSPLLFNLSTLFNLSLWPWNNSITRQWLSTFLGEKERYRTLPSPDSGWLVVQRTNEWIANLIRCDCVQSQTLKLRFNWYPVSLCACRALYNVISVPDPIHFTIQQQLFVALSPQCSLFVLKCEVEKVNSQLRIDRNHTMGSVGKIGGMTFKHYHRHRRTESKYGSNWASRLGP